MPDLSSPLLQPQDLLTQGGATFAVTVIANGLQYAFGLKPRYVGLSASFGIALLGLAISENISWVQGIMVIPNAFLIYAGAVGLTAMGTAASNQQASNTEETSPEGPEETSPERVKKFWKPWF